jgi:hypothetical protein
VIQLKGKNYMLKKKMKKLRAQINLTKLSKKKTLLKKSLLPSLFFSQSPSNHQIFINKKLSSKTINYKKILSVEHRSHPEFPKNFIIFTRKKQRLIDYQNPLRENCPVPQKV